MGEEGNPSPEAKVRPPEAAPQITLFGKRMDLLERAEASARGQSPALGSSQRAPHGYDSAGERRTFWLVVTTFAVVFAIAFLAARLFRWKEERPAVASAAQRAAPTLVAQESAAPPSSGAAVQVPAAPPDGAAPGVATAETPAPAGVERVESPVAHKRVPRRGRVAKPVPKRPARRAAARRPSPGRRGAVPDAYVQGLRERMQQYDRDKAQGKYQEFRK